jgi:exodeoxyribonuclease VII large subunit
MLETSSESPVPVRVISEAIGAYLGKLGPIWIEGELSEVTVRPGAPMVFMRLRDTSADMSLSIMCHRSVLEAVSPLPQNARVVMHAKVSWYAKSGSISMSVKEIRQVGIGELLARLEHLKSVLAAEGLFNADRKQALPFLPKVVGLICGRNSDAEKDVVENAKRRWPSAALRELDAHPDVDVIIITRGGGSFEDLLPFSDEGLVRLVGAAKTPIVSAIGHEKDSPLLDLVADWRASTPTDAGKKVVPDVVEELAKISRLQDRAHRQLGSKVELEFAKITHLTDRPVLRDPMVMISSRHEIVTTLSTRSFRGMWHLLVLATEEISNLGIQARTLSPQATLDRGYAVVQKASGEIIRAASNVTSGEQLRVRLAEGELSAIAE